MKYLYNLDEPTTLIKRYFKEYGNLNDVNSEANGLHLTKELISFVLKEILIDKSTDISLSDINSNLEKLYLFKIPEEKANELMSRLYQTIYSIIFNKFKEYLTNYDYPLKIKSIEVQCLKDNVSAIIETSEAGDLLN